MAILGERQVLLSLKVEGTGDISFYILNEETFKKWKSGERVLDAYIARNLVSENNIRWLPAETGDYYFLFDNTHSEIAKRCRVQVLPRKLGATR